MLESVNYDQDRAIDVLLGMSDPKLRVDCYSRGIGELFHNVHVAQHPHILRSTSNPISHSTNNSQDNSLWKTSSSQDMHLAHRGPEEAMYRMKRGDQIRTINSSRDTLLEASAETSKSSRRH